jgi:hypothetical protein
MTLRPYDKWTPRERRERAEQRERIAPPPKPPAPTDLVDACPICQRTSEELCRAEPPSLPPPFTSTNISAARLMDIFTSTDISAARLMDMEDT